MCDNQSPNDDARLECGCEDRGENALRLARACLDVAPLFTRLGEEGFIAAVERGVVRDVSACAGIVFEPCSIAARGSFERELLVAGLPLAALPVESLYKPWRAPDGTVRATGGLYGGESARHVQALLAACGLELPAAFSAMPDHLAVLLELLACFLEAEDEQAARTLVQDHFDWLASYDAVLAERAERVAEAPAFDEDRRRDLAEGIAFMRSLVKAVDKAVHDEIVGPYA